MINLSVMTNNNFALKLVLLAMCFFALYACYLKLKDINKPLDAYLKEAWALDMYEAYLQAVRAGNYDKIISEDDLKFIALSDNEFALEMLRLRAHDATLLRIYKGQNVMRIEQAKKFGKWIKKEESDSSITYVKEEVSPPTLADDTGDMHVIRKRVANIAPIREVGGR